MLFRDLVDISLRVGRTSKRGEKTAIIAEGMRRMAPDELPTGVSHLAGILPQGRIGIGYAQLYGNDTAPPSSTAALSIMDVSRHIDAIAAVKGKGSVARREEELGKLMAASTVEEQEFLRG